MKALDIVKAVRWCIDEEAGNVSALEEASAFDYDSGAHTDQGLMNNIIKNKIGTALRWVCLYAPAEQLSGGSASSEVSGGSSGTVSGDSVATSSSIDIIKEETPTPSNQLITLDPAFIRLIRVKGNHWHRAIMGESLIREDSGEYLQLRDPNGATATVDRPQAALINTKVKKVEVWPANYQSGETSVTDSFTVTYVVAPSAEDLSALDEQGWENVEVGVPPMVETSFIYYLAYLLLSAYGDPRAKSMFDIATLNLGKTDDKQRQ